MKGEPEAMNGVSQREFERWVSKKKYQFHERMWRLVEADPLYRLLKPWYPKYPKLERWTIKVVRWWLWRERDKWRREQSRERSKLCGKQKAGKTAGL